MIGPRTLTLLAIAALATAPDEGQWLPQQILTMDWDALRKRGLELSKDEFWHPERGGVLTAAVQINGCSASFVSADGLLVTNHHCAFGAINRLSTVKRNLVRDGFVATSREAELAAPGVQVYVVRKIEDVTAAIHAEQARASNDLDRWQRTQRKIAELVATGEKQPNTACHVASFLEGQTYHLYHRTRIEDVRLVYAPPRSVGEYGGEVDNWEWPRHTGDFAFLRAYVAPDGSPRPFAEDNVPHRPDHYLRVSPDGVDAGDLVLIMGYPGRTERYLTSAAVADRQGYFYPKRHELFSAILEILDRAGAGDEALALRLESRIKSLANVQKNALGMVEGLARNGVVAHKLREEESFRSWLAAAPERAARFGTVLEEMLALDVDARRTQEKDMLLGLLTSTFFARPLAMLTAAVSQVLDADDDEWQLPARLKAMLEDRSFDEDPDSIVRPILKVLLDEARGLPDDQQLAGTAWLRAAPADRDTAALVDEALARTAMLTTRGRLELFGRGPTAVRQSTDPLVVLARGLAAEARSRVRRDTARNGRRLLVGRRWVEAQQAWRGTSFYPDANSTMRVSIATVKGYAPRDGVRHVPHTTVAGILEKNTGEAPFDSPDALLAAAARRAGSRFHDADVGDVPVCFLADGDTTGGNSGSPVIDGKGRLVGLNFDRVFENVAGDYGWRPERSRNISVDIRFVLWFLEDVVPAPHLLREMGL